MPSRIPVTPLLQSLPPMVPFVAPDALERRLGRPITLRLGANESAFGVSPGAQRAMTHAIEHVAWYGDPESFRLRQRLADLHQVTPEHLIVGSGIDDLLGNVVRAFVAPHTPVVASVGCYPTFTFHIRGHGGALHSVPYQDDHNDLHALSAAAQEHRARLCYLANPDNPSGSWHHAKDVLALLDRLPPDCLLVLDEAYADFAPPGTLPEHPADDPRLIRLRTFSKAHGMAGARIGYAITAPRWIAEFDKIRLHFGVNRVAQAGAIASLDEPEFIAGVVAEVARGRLEYASLGATLGLRTLPSATNFVAFDCGTPENAQTLLERLLHEGVFVRILGVPPMSRCIRVTVGRAEEREAFAVIMQRLADQRQLPL